jgi:hypothetical protein
VKGIVFLCASGWLSAGIVSQAGAQGRPAGRQMDTDTSYVKSYITEVTARLFLSQKYTGLRVPGTSTIPDFRYRPNTTLNLGIGATYRSLTLNLAYGFPGLNGDGSERGKTRYLDMQAHLYGRKLVIDFFGQFYKGYFLSPKDYISGFPGYYIRPDVRINMVGGSAYYVFNHRKFSYRAGFIQNEWQSRSAGTFLLGGDVYYGVVNSDSLLIPPEIAHQFPHGQVKRFRFFNIGPGGGYAYTFVYKRNWFATGSLTVNIPIDFVKESTHSEDKNRISVSPNFMARLAVGYNSRRWVYSATVVNSMVTANGSFNEGIYRISTGNYRLTAARRFTLSRKTKKAIKPVEEALPLPK